MQKNYIYFPDRKGRAKFISKVFEKELSSSQSVLDVGCDYNSLQKILGPKVIGVDLYGAPDFTVNFEQEKLTRFKSGEFDFVVCTEVLEHLDNFHEMIDEINRVSNQYILISLPNCMDIFTRLNILLHGKAGKFYGLPNRNPEDRHRWFFGHTDIEDFFRDYSKRHNLSVERRFLHCNFSSSWRGIFIRSFVRIFNIDSAAQSYWILLRKNGSTL